MVKAELIKAFNQYAREKGLAPATSKKAFGTAMLDQMIIPVETVTPKSMVGKWKLGRVGSVP